MGWLKDKYQALDTKLGGILPGKGNEEAAAPVATPTVAQPTSSAPTPYEASATAPNMSTEAGPAYSSGEATTVAPTGQSKASTPYEASGTAPTSTEPTIPEIPESVRADLPIQRGPLGEPGYEAPNKVLSALDWYFSDKNPVEKALGNSPEYNAQTGQYELNDFESNAIAFPGTGSIVKAGEKVLAKETEKRVANQLAKTAEKRAAAKLAAKATTKDTFKAVDTLQAADNAFLAEGGESVVAQTIPEASGLLTSTGSYKSTFGNNVDTAITTKSTRTIGTMFKEWFSSQSGTVKVGGVLGLSQIITAGWYGAPQTNREIDTIVSNAPKDIETLKEAGMILEADALTEAVDKLHNTSGFVKSFTSFYGRIHVGNMIGEINADYEPKIQEAKNMIEANEKTANDFDDTTDAKIKVNAYVSEEDLIKSANHNPGGLAAQLLYSKETLEVNQNALDIQNNILKKMIGMSDKDIINNAEIAAAVNDPRNEGSLIVQLYNSAIDGAEKELATQQSQLYSQYQKEEQRDYNEAQTAEQRAYSESQTAAAYEQKAIDEATDTQEAGSSTLNFGILNSSGEQEFVDRDAASNVYFGVVYEELTPAQKKLLMLSKGTQ